MGHVDANNQTIGKAGSKRWLAFRRRKRAKHVVHKANNMSLHFGWTCGANKVVFGPKYHWWKQIQIWILTCWGFIE